MADLETRLRWLSERGDPVGADELIERLEADLAGEHSLVVAGRRGGPGEIPRGSTISRLRSYRGPAWAVVTFVAILAVAGLYLAFAGGGEVAESPPPPTPSVPVVPEPTAVAPEGDTTLEVAGGAEAFLLAGGDAAGGPWSYWVWTSHCERLGATVVYQWIEYAPFRDGHGIDLEKCSGGDSRVQPYVVELLGIGGDELTFVYGQTALNVVRVKAVLADGREFEADTLAAPDELGWNARFYAVPVPADSQIQVVKGYDSNGRYVGGNMDPGEGAPEPGPRMPS